eukprot:scaffold1659_cov371-Prasinococcus_capsulatus_cf.AAC.5
MSRGLGGPLPNVAMVTHSLRPPAQVSDGPGQLVESAQAVAWVSPSERCRHSVAPACSAFPRPQTPHSSMDWGTHGGRDGRTGWLAGWLDGCWDGRRLAWQRTPRGCSGSSASRLAGRGQGARVATAGGGEAPIRRRALQYRTAGPSVPDDDDDVGDPPHLRCRFDDSSEARFPGGRGTD